VIQEKGEPQVLYRQTFDFICEDCFVPVRCAKEKRLLSDPPKYVNICPKCGKSYILSYSFPATLMGTEDELEDFKSQSFYHSLRKYKGNEKRLDSR